MPTTAVLLELRDIRASFGGVRALDGATFSVEAGTITGLIGPNGAGKTTVFDAISGFVPARGRIRLDGVDLATLPPDRRARARLGRSFQDARLFPSLTVFEALCVASERHIRAEGVVSTALRLPWVRRTERRVARRAEDLIELMGLDAFRDKFVSELSTGSRRIVDLAVVLIHDPLVLLLDEPSSGIAQRETEALAPLLIRIRQETGASLLVIEHDMPLIRSVADEILALETGSVLTRGKPDEVLEDPRLVSAYLGTDRSVVERSGAGVMAAEPSSDGARPTRRAAARRRASRVDGGKVAAPVAGAARRAGGKKAPAGGGEVDGKGRTRRAESSEPAGEAAPRPRRAATGTKSKAAKSGSTKAASTAQRSRSRVSGGSPMEVTEPEGTGGGKKDRARSR
jgi:ABC-type branched-subunit amino acid transport system ATPase component